MIHRHVKNGRYPIHGNGLTFDYPVYINNLVDGFVLTLETGAGAGRAWGIADDEYFNIEKRVERAVQALGVPLSTHHLPLLLRIIASHVREKACRPFGIEPPIFPRRVDWFRQVRVLKIDRARTDLRHTPDIGIDEGSKLTGQSYAEHNYI